MYGLFFTWHGWLALAVLAASGFCAVYRLRNTLGRWAFALAVSAVIVVGVSAGQLVSNYEGTVTRAGIMSRVSRGGTVTRVPAIEWASTDGRKHTTEVTMELMGKASAGQKIRKRIGRWYPELSTEKVRESPSGE